MTHGTPPFRPRSAPAQRRSNAPPRVTPIRVTVRLGCRRILVRDAAQLSLSEVHRLIDWIVGMGPSESRVPLILEDHPEPFLDGRTHAPAFVWIDEESGAAPREAQRPRVPRRRSPHRPPPHAPVPCRAWWWGTAGQPYAQGLMGMLETLDWSVASQATARVAPWRSPSESRVGRVG